jgi:hypothetical protein
VLQCWFPDVQLPYDSCYFGPAITINIDIEYSAHHFRSTKQHAYILKAHVPMLHRDQLSSVSTKAKQAAAEQLNSYSTVAPYPSMLSTALI